MYDFEPMSLHPDEIVDSRFLYFEVEYHRLDLFQMRNLAQRVLLKIDELFGECFFLEWRDANRRTNFEKILNSVCNNPKPWAVVWMVNGVATSSVVYNQKTYKQYEKWMEQQLIFRTVPTEVPLDYLDVCEEYFSNACDNEQKKHALLSLYNKDGLVKKSYWRRHEFSGLMRSSFYRDNPGQYYGYLYFRVARACLSSDGCIAFADELSSFLQEIGADIPNVSGRVALSPVLLLNETCCSHMVYFGWEEPPVKVTPPLRIQDSEWRTYYYLRGVEWCNLISPLQAKRLSLPCADNAAGEAAVIKPIPGGAFIVQSPKDILHTDVSDLMPLKLMLYDILYPGSRQFDSEIFWNPRLTDGRWGPRTLWMMTPLLPEEVEVTDQYVLFKHRNPSLMSRDVKEAVLLTP